LEAAKMAKQKEESIADALNKKAVIADCLNILMIQLACAG